MNIYNILSNGILKRHEKKGSIQDCNLEPVVSLEREVFSSEEVVPLVENGVLDTNDRLTIQKYQSNLKNLIQKTLDSRKVQSFRLIREDDFFPYDWEWRVNSIDTGREFAPSTLAYTLRMEEARSHLRKKYGETPYYFEIPFSPDEENLEAQKLGKDFGKIYEPVHFRSTKHFTINTPLSYTGSYNQVESNRKFIVIDKADSFCQSGYGYSADYFDAYLDVTHEALPISEDATILIEESRYPDIVKEVGEEALKGRRIVLYRGDAATAINMVLSEEGVLPYRMGRYYEMNSELEEIFQKSMMDFSLSNGLEYSHNHGNFNGKGGHFSDLLDSENRERREFEEEFCDFLGKKYPNYAGLFTTTFYRYPQKIIKAIGPEKVLRGIDEYNFIAKEDEIRRREEYKEDRKNVTSEVHNLFLDTLQLIKNYYEKGEYNEPLHFQILRFFHGRDVATQVDAARVIQSVLREEKTMS